MDTVYQLFPSDYNDLQVLFFYDKTADEWYMDESSLMSLSNLKRDEFVQKMNRADYRKTSKGRWIVSLLDAYLILPDAPRNWVFAEHQERLPLRLTSGTIQDSILISLREATRKYIKVGSLRKSRGNSRQDTLDSIRSRSEKNIRILARYGLNEQNSVIIRDAIKTMKDEHGTSVA